MFGTSTNLYPTQYKEVWDSDAPPKDPHPYNDEFDDNSLSSQWKKEGTTDESTLSGLKIGNGRVYLEVPTSGNFTFWTRVEGSGTPNLNANKFYGIHVQVGTGQVNAVSAYTFTDYIKYEVNTFTNWYNWSSTPVSLGNHWTNAFYAACKRSGNDISFWISSDGIGYWRAYSSTLANVSRIGLHAVSSDEYGQFRFFRFLPYYTNQHTLLPGGKRRIYYD